jgi:phenylpropionate dioxygenase-like ring-hydroxylating dioxygenase large terminal subunit
VPAPFPLNAWYAAAWDVDLKHALFPRTICGKHVVMYRQSNGQVCALDPRSRVTANRSGRNDIVHKTFVYSNGI